MKFVRFDYQHQTTAIIRPEAIEQDRLQAQVEMIQDRSKMYRRSFLKPSHIIID